MKSKFIYRCNDCGSEYGPSGIMYLCPRCSNGNKPLSPPRGVLKTLYDYDEIRKDGKRFESLREESFLSLLPVESVASMPPLRVGNTPMYHVNELDGISPPAELWIKDDSQNPTYSFKDRASSLVAAWASENGIDTIVTASTGNAGSSLAGICAAAHLNAVIIVPEKAPLAKLTQILMYGARLIPVKGTYDDAFDLSIRATREFGWFNRNTAYNPLTIEGKKTAAFEIYEQLGCRVPDLIFIPAGDGVITSGIYKGFEELMILEITDTMPAIVAVQSQGSDNLHRNINSDDFVIRASDTIADSISVDIPRNFLMTRRYLTCYGGTTMTVTDDQIVSASRKLSANTGLFAEPASAAAFAGFLSYFSGSKGDTGKTAVVLHTGSGLKDLAAAAGTLKLPEAVSPSTDMKELLR